MVNIKNKLSLREKQKEMDISTDKCHITFKLFAGEINNMFKFSKIVLLIARTHDSYSGLNSRRHGVTRWSSTDSRSILKSYG